MPENHPHLELCAVIDEAPRPGSRRTTVAFIHPTTSFGTPIELVQE